jgi:hypothetical protein
MVRLGTRLSDEVVVGVLIEHVIIGPADLARLGDPVWRSRQEDLWWQLPSGVDPETGLGPRRA